MPQAKYKNKYRIPRSSALFLFILALRLSSEDLVDGKVVSVPEELYKKGCIQDVAEGLKVR